MSSLARSASDDAAVEPGLPSASPDTSGAAASEDDDDDADVDAAAAASDAGVHPTEEPAREAMLTTIAVLRSPIKSTVFSRSRDTSSCR